MAIGCSPAAWTGGWRKSSRTKISMCSSGEIQASQPTELWYQLRVLTWDRLQPDLFTSRAPNGTHHALQAFFPRRKQVDIMHLVGDAAGNRAVVEPHRDHEHGVERPPARAIERPAQLALKLPQLGNGPR